MKLSKTAKNTGNIKLFMKISELRPFDEIVISGKITSEGGHAVKDLGCVVATVSPPDEESVFWYVKVWPNGAESGKLPAGHDGKLWFSEESVEEIRLVERDEEL